MNTVAGICTIVLVIHQRGDRLEFMSVPGPRRRLVVEVMDEEMAKVIRAKTGAERLKIASDMYSSARRMLLSYLRGEHPEWSEEQINREASRRLSHGAV